MDNFKGKTDVRKHLKKVPLLSKLSDDELKTLVEKLTNKSYKDKEDIIKQGEPGLGFFLIQEGKVVVTRMKDVKDPSTKSEIGRLRAGDFFGEAALINNMPRGATVSASGPVSCFYLARNDFNALFGSGKLNVQFAKRKAVSAEAMGGGKQEFSGKPADAKTTKSPAQKDLIKTAVKFNVLFMNHDDDTQNRIIDDMYMKDVVAGTSVIVQGALGDNLYVVESGEFHVFVNGVRVAIRGKGTCFGELALMYNSPRAATVTASTDAVVWVVDRFTFRRIVTDTGSKMLQDYTNFLSKVDLLSSLSSFEREKIAEALEEVPFQGGDVVFKQGGEGDAMYLVHSGTFSVIKDGEKILEIKSGGFFGERALIKHEPRAATISALTAAKTLRLDAHAFSLLLGPLEDIMQKKVTGYEKAGKSEEKTEQKKAQVDVKREDLETIGTLGKGSFGHVTLVKDNAKNKTYALKAVSKAQIVQTGQQGHIMSEKRVMEQLDHPFLVKLWATYKDKDRLYFLLEPSLGGELFSVLREKTLFDEDTAKFYAGSVVLAFEYMHSKNFVYRDLKPENLLLDEKGFLQVTDFGFAKDISGGRTWTLCGTPDYLAPEIVAGKGHGKGVDWWTLGVFIYEMLASYPPFYDEDPMKTYAKIMHGSISFPSHFSKESVSLVKKLLHHKPTKRLGVVKGGAKLIKKHPWFKGFSFEGLFGKTMKVPIVPQIRSATDLSNFDDYGDEEDEIQPYVDDGSGWDEDF
jgi:cGMP-dependent protein kinase